jgi:hypothetical protein
MKQSKNELDVDFIGGQGSLTKDEAMAISAFIASEKVKREKQQQRLTMPGKRKNLQHN